MQLWCDAAIAEANCTYCTVLLWYTVLVHAKLHWSWFQNFALYLLHSLQSLSPSHGMFGGPKKQATAAKETQPAVKNVHCGCSGRVCAFHSAICSHERKRRLSGWTCEISEAATTKKKLLVPFFFFFEQHLNKSSNDETVEEEEGEERRERNANWISGKSGREEALVISHSFQELCALFFFHEKSRWQ